MNWEQLSAQTLDAAFPHLAPFSAPVLLSGGFLNFVWRVNAASGSAIAKRAPPWAASVPEVSLSPKRLLLEARALRQFEHAPLNGLTTAGVRPPRLLGFCRKAWLLLEEDVGAGPDLSEALRDQALFSQLGAFIAGLHRETFGSAIFRRRFANVDIQRARLASQYGHVGAFAELSGAQDAEALGAGARDLGRRLVEPGRCLVMGDLWPASVLPRPDGLRLIDWEFATYGSPAQDVGHLVAHLVLLGLTNEPAQGAIEAFLTAYRAGLGSRFGELWDEGVHRDAGVHLGCELLARVWGPFRASAGLHETARFRATSEALTAMRQPGGVPALEVLRPAGP